MPGTHLRNPGVWRSPLVGQELPVEHDDDPVTRVSRAIDNTGVMGGLSGLNITDDQPPPGPRAWPNRIIENLEDAGRAVAQLLN